MNNQKLLHIVPSLIALSASDINPGLLAMMQRDVGPDSMGDTDWTMGADALWSDDYAGDDYAGDDQAGDDQAGDDHAGIDFLGALYQQMRRGRGAPPARRGAPPARPGARPGVAGLAGQLGRVLNQPPQWRQPQAAPGVMQPFEGLVRLPFTPSVPNGVFTAGATTWQFTGKPQKPWRGERMVAIVTRSTGASSIIPLLTNTSVGIDPQQAAAARAVLEQTLRNAQHILQEENTNQERGNTNC